MLHIGVDEAGYGPLLGPLVIGLSAFRLHDEADAPAFDPWTTRLRARLKGTVCRVSRKARSERLPVPVDDSKRVLQRHGREGLARGVGVFAAAMDQPPPAHLADLLCRYSDRQPDGYADAPWFRDLHRVPVPRYPWTGPLADRWARRGVEALDLRVLPADASELNASFAALDNKANVLGLLSATLLVSVLDRHPGEDAHVVMDRQGARLDYAGYLAQVFPFARVTPVRAPERESRYVVELPDRCLRIRFVTKGDQVSLAVGWASVAAKLTRELFMDSFNAWFHRRRPELKPTAGYHTDGRRFLEDVDDLIQGEAIDRGLLVRSR